MIAAPLAGEFYDRSTLNVARDLLGCRLVHDSPEGRTSGLIVEVEAYHGEDDPACHAAVGRTGRTEPMYGAAGHAYVYFVYGMHHCLNVVTRGVGCPSAVLIRAIEPVEGIDLMRVRRDRESRARRQSPPEPTLTNGPGKVCQAMGLSLEHNRLDLTRPPLWIEAGRPPGELAWTPRVGITEGADRYWRVIVKDSSFVSPSKLNREVVDQPRPVID